MQITQEAVAELFGKMTPKALAAPSATDQLLPVTARLCYAGVSRQVIRVVTVPNWQPGMGSDVFR
ncbi:MULTISPECIES: hypothetical protein [Streptomyces]|uniref:hypothetical protein n=1 Tax=Streptomyces TaxID=1883 RepID=UPI001BDC5D1D|nr:MULTISPECIES: hypothetical protein [Streptomyces]MBT1104334.1 hypothetical protein [Streptomyces sp. Tu10]WUC90725.1 hypothetical protein OHQ35_33455 [Streptomyces anulatus]WUD93012.1 hypothetical protein OG703_34660 [Streptomyces anulatus]